MGPLDAIFRSFVAYDSDRVRFLRHTIGIVGHDECDFTMRVLLETDTPASLAPSCPLAASSTDAPDCSRRLLLSECLQDWQREAQPGEMDTGRYRCSYVSWGEGPALVCIPGMASNAQSFAMLMARLRKQFRCISYNLPDGVSDGARLLRYRHEDLTKDLFALLDHLRIRTCFVLGFSFGSTIALSALHRQGARFNAAILQGGFAHRSFSKAEIFCAHWLRYLPGRLGNLPLMRRLLERNHREPFLQREPDVWDFFLRQQCRIPIRTFASRILMLQRLDLRPILPTIPHRVLMVCGDRDPLVGKICERELRQGLRFASRAEIEQCGHQPHLTHPEVLAELLRQYLLPMPCRG